MEAQTQKAICKPSHKHPGIAFSPYPAYDRNMPVNTNALRLFCFVLLTWMLAIPQAKLSAQNQPNKPPTQVRGADYSGMYNFLTDGELSQLTVEDRGDVTGFVSRYGDAESDRGVFLDHFFKSGKLDGDQLTFATETVHGVSYEFHRTIDRGDGKSRGDEAYYVLKGTLIENTNDAGGKMSSRAIAVALKSFPQDMDAPQAGKK